MSRIAVIGNLSVDRIAGAPPRAGGGVFHAARAAARIGADVAVVTRCAPDDRATALAPLEALGPSVTCGDATVTTAFTFHYEGERRVMTVDAVGDPWTPADVQGWARQPLGDADWLLVAGLLRTDFPAATLAALAAPPGEQGQSRRRLLLDAQGIARIARTGPLAEDGDLDRAVFAELAVLKLNEDEATILAGGTDAASLRTLGVPEVVLTLGSRGAVVVTDDDVTEVAPHAKPDSADPTGAGDVFSLVYLDGRAWGASPREAGDRAAAIAAELIS